MTKLDDRDYAALMRLDLYSFTQRSFLTLNPQTTFLGNWHLELIAAKLEACRFGQCRRLIINLPPRSLKSICASVAFPAWLLGHNPSVRVICASYGMDLAAKHALDCRILMEDPFYRGLFPGTAISAKKQMTADFMTTAQGGRMATSVGGVLTGRGADFIIIDDPLKPEEACSETQRRAVNEWFDHTLLSRLDNKNTGVIIIIMQRLHLDDLVGHVMEQGGWEILNLPALAIEDERYQFKTPFGEVVWARRTGEALHPARDSVESLAAMRRAVGEYVFAGQYQQDPVPLGGGMVKFEWFQRYARESQPEVLKKGGQVIQSWDTANKASQLSDYSVCTTWLIQEKRIYLLDVFRRRLDYPALKRAVSQQAEAWQPTVILIEDKASGTQLIQELQTEGLYAVKGVKPEGDKVMRLHAQTATIENGFVYLPTEASWLLDYVAEVTSFPKGKYDDQVDSTSQALAWIKAGQSGSNLGLYLYMKAEHAAAHGLVPSLF